MKKLFWVSILIWFTAAPALADPIIEFSPGSSPAGGWSYDGAGKISFEMVIDVDQASGSSADTLVGAWVRIPALSVTGIPGGPYGLTPVTDSNILITNSSGTITYLSGTLGPGDLVPVGPLAAGYTAFQADITNIIINNTISSDALAAIAAITNPTLDFELSFQGAPEQGFQWMLDNGISDNDGFSGAMTIVPEPATICLLAIGSLTFLRKKKI